MHVVVVGAGVTGLVAAWALRREDPSTEVTVLEAARRVGGRLTLGDLGGHAVDAGAEAVADVPAVRALLSDVGLADRVLRPATTSVRVLLDDGLRPLPTGTVMGVPGDLVALARSGVLSRRGLVRAGLDAVLPVDAAGGDVALGRYVTSRLGLEVTRRLVGPLLAERYAGDVDRLSLTALLPDLAVAREQGRRPTQAAAELTRTPVLAPDGRPRALGLRDGLGRLPAAVASASGATVRTGTTVRALSRMAQGRWRLECGPVPRPWVVEADAVVVAVPAVAAARLLRPVVPGAATALDTVSSASVAVVTLAYRAKQVAAGSLEGAGHVVASGGPVRAVGLASRRWAWLAEALPDLTVLRVSLGRHGDEPALAQEDAELVTLAARHCSDVLGVTARPAAGAVFRWGGAVPQYSVGHPARAQRVHALLAQQPGLALAGSALDGVGIDACVVSAQAAARRVLSARAQAQPLP